MWYRNQSIKIYYAEKFLITQSSLNNLNFDLAKDEIPNNEISPLIH